MRPLKITIWLGCLLFGFSACEEETAVELTQAERDDVILQAYFEENQISPTRTASGLYYEILDDTGNGIVPSNGDIIAMHYEGKLLYGDIFDSSYFRDEPFVIQQGTGFIVEEYDENGNPIISGNEVIGGWIEATQLMEIGAKYRFYLPSDLAYGNRRAGSIPPFSILIFEMEILEIID